MSRNSTDSRRGGRNEENLLGTTGRGGVNASGSGRGANPGKKASGRGRGASVSASVGNTIRDDDGQSLASQASGSVREEVGEDGVFSQERMETTPARSIPPGTQASVMLDRERAKRTIEERSPNMEVPLRNIRQRLNEFDVAEIFSEVEYKLAKSLEEVVASTPEPLKEAMAVGMAPVRSAIVGILNGLSDGAKQERMAREAMEMRIEDKLERMEEKVKEIDAATDSLTRTRIKTRTRESVKEMESKVREAQCSLKLLDIDIERVTEDRREIVRKTITKMRQFVEEDDKRGYDMIIRRTRIVIMGKSTSRRLRDSDVEYSVPTLLQCRDRRDTEDLEAILRAAGYFPSFHWPREMMEFVGRVRDEVKQQGVDDRVNFSRVRPGMREGKLMVKVEVKPKEGLHRFSLKGLWDIPPMNRVLWDDVQDMFRSKMNG